MGLFKSKAEKELDAVIRRLEMNMSNNYKDNAQDDLKELEATLGSLKESGGIKPGAAAKYEGILGKYKEKMVGYSHKDQKPYWH